MKKKEQFSKSTVKLSKPMIHTMVAIHNNPKLREWEINIDLNNMDVNKQFCQELLNAGFDFSLGDKFRVIPTQEIFIKGRATILNAMVNDIEKAQVTSPVAERLFSQKPTKYQVACAKMGIILS